MSLNRLLLLAGLLATGACQQIPTGAPVCAVDEQNANLDTEEYLCPDFGSPASGITQQDGEASTASDWD